MKESGECERIFIITETRIKKPYILTFADIQIPWDLAGYQVKSTSKMVMSQLYLALDAFCLKILTQSLIFSQQMSVFTGQVSKTKGNKTKIRKTKDTSANCKWVSDEYLVSTKTRKKVLFWGGDVVYEV